MTEAQDKQERLKGLYKKYGIKDEGGGAPKPQKKQKSWIRGVIDAFLERFKRKKKPPEITRPAGVRTPEQIKEWQEIMEIKKRKNQ